MMNIKIKSAIETIFNNRLLVGWSFNSEKERFIFEKDHLKIIVEPNEIYFINPSHENYKISNPFFISEFQTAFFKMHSLR